MFQQFEDFSDDQVVKFVYEDGCDVFHFNETHIETALQETLADRDWETFLPPCL